MGLSYGLYTDDGSTKNVGLDGKYIKLTLYSSLIAG